MIKGSTKSELINGIKIHGNIFNIGNLKKIIFENF